MYMLYIQTYIYIHAHTYIYLGFVRESWIIVVGVFGHRIYDGVVCLRWAQIKRHIMCFDQCTRCMYVCMHVCIWYCDMSETSPNKASCHALVHALYVCMYVCMHVCIWYCGMFKAPKLSATSCALTSARAVRMYVCMHVCIWYCGMSEASPN